MTTTVKISAHCADNKEVMIEVKDETQGLTTQQVIQNGEVHEVYAYDARVIRVFERVKGEIQ